MELEEAIDTLKGPGRLEQVGGEGGSGGVGGEGGGEVMAGLCPRSSMALIPELMYTLAMSTPICVMPALVWCVSLYTTLLLV